MQIINLNFICNIIYFNTFCSEIDECKSFKLMLIQRTTIKKIINCTTYTRNRIYSIQDFS